jgi:hypothetical protein
MSMAPKRINKCFDSTYYGNRSQEIFVPIRINEGIIWGNSMIHIRMWRGRIEVHNGFDLANNKVDVFGRFDISNEVGDIIISVLE